MSQFTYSSQNNPCPICERVKDGDCRWNNEVVFCHSFIDEDAKVSGYVYRGSTDDGMWGQYFPETEGSISPKSIYRKPIRPVGTREFIYKDAEGNPLVKVVRKDLGDGEKDFFQHRWDGQSWIPGLTDEVKNNIHLYRIYESINQNAIAQNTFLFLVEGEHKVDRLIQLGIPATCSIGGSKAWNRYGYPNYLEDLKGANLIICPDQDLPGIEYGEAIRKDFPECRWLYVFPESPVWGNLPEKNGLDIADWIEKGATKEEILSNVGDKRDINIQVNDSKTEETKEKPKQKTLAELAIEIASEATYFHTEDRNAYAEIQVNGHREVHLIRSKAFKHWLGYHLYTQHSKTLGSETLNTVLSILEAQALYEGESHTVHLRVAESDGKIYIDLGTPDWNAVEVDSQEWSIVSDYPVKFRRSPYQLPLPIPTRGGGVEELRQILNFDESDWVLVLCWITFCFIPYHPHPILILQGEQGSGKSFASRTLKSLVDPAKSPLQPEPKDLRNLAINANNRWLIAFDNLSSISNSQSDALCRIATGGGFTTRTLFENDEETIFEFIRPMLINGIDSIATRSDLLERSILVTLPTISEDQRLTEDELKLRQSQVLP